jgi:tagaturonate reductase
LDEIVPSLDVPDGEPFAIEVLTRFANPYLHHALRDISVQHTAKMRIRVVPSIMRFAERTGRAPTLLAFGFAAYLRLLRTAQQSGATALGTDQDAEPVRALWRKGAGATEAAVRRLVDEVCRNDELWNVDLTQVSGFVRLVADHLTELDRIGVEPALAALMRAR